MEILSQNLRTLRKAKNWSQQAVADEVYISPVSLSHYENGRHEPSIDALRRLSRLYGVTLDDLVNAPIQKTA
jgi:transcriptional regulator with XRE-family HTH domain